MPRYETAGSDSSFTFQISFAEADGAWMIEDVRILGYGQPIFYKDSFSAHFAAKVLAICHGIEVCEAMSRQLAARSTDSHFAPSRRNETL